MFLLLSPTLRVMAREGRDVAIGTSGSLDCLEWYYKIVLVLMIIDVHD